MDQSNQQGERRGSSSGSRRNRGQNIADIRSNHDGPTTSIMSTSMLPPTGQAHASTASGSAAMGASSRQQHQSDIPNTAQHSYMSHQGGPASAGTQSAMDYAMASAEQFSRGAQNQNQYQHRQPQHHQQHTSTQSAPRIPLPMHDQAAYPYGSRHIHDRPIVKLSVSLIDTYKNINRVYYEDKKARTKAKSLQSSVAKKTGSLKGVHNNGWDDENYDYIINEGGLILDRYEIKAKIGKVRSFLLFDLINMRLHQPYGPDSSASEK